ncbi:ABC-2 type transport system ATP-binding protein [Tamaricihabitans halophyticus]|uniref:ABC-2 type transport system ATP-binding protein n=1 Tax=Tamaricihabitans halophyticus TaxID=1262583 RepID=A0A4R2QDM3_9PSEU|nr:ABC transporter ATP-binding protein [Tamaricihabitans halophyticus]TCP45025.1 ABC-2 type transport system ATP-binding protein [Tamaricihabitans halophyticus]
MTVIEANGLAKRYGDNVVVDGVSLSVKEGEIFGILGPNGAGKTTTVECIAGLRKPDAGSVSIMGLDPQRETREVRKLLGMQLQHSELPEKMRVYEAMKMFSSFYPNPTDSDTLLERLGLLEKRKSPFSKLSGGQQQRLSIALALIGQPKVAILDELTTGLDPSARRNTWKLVEDIRSTGVTIVLVTHFMEEAERLCDRLALIDQGKVVAVDSPAGLIEQVDTGKRLRFRPSGPFDHRLLTDLDDVVDVSEQGSQIVVSGTGNLLQSVSARLASHDIVANDLRVEQASLEDAFVALTGRSIELGEHSERAA